MSDKYGHTIEAGDFTVLGAKSDDKGTNFALFSSSAERVDCVSTMRAASTKRPD